MHLLFARCRDPLTCLSPVTYDYQQLPKRSDNDDVWPTHVNIDFGHVTSTLSRQTKEGQRQYRQCNIIWSNDNNHLIVAGKFQDKPVWGMLNSIATVVTLTHWYIFTDVLDGIDPPTSIGLRIFNFRLFSWTTPVRSQTSLNIIIVEYDNWERIPSILR